ncbi:hypothetical protein HW509_14165 [Asaia spathodeae]|uniref:hypothetical protein n=1 Tax=Asaia spathodeae TaxID=657016 RepID=UPI002FC2FDE3
MAKKAPLSLGTMTASPAPTGERKASTQRVAAKRGDGPRGYNFRMWPRDLAALKQAALNHDMTLRDIFAAALTDWLARNNGVAHTFEPVTTEKKEAE